MASSLAVTNPPVDPIPPATSTAATVWSSSMRSHHMETLMRLWHGCLAVVIALFAQLLIAGIQRPLAERNVDFPPSILAMAVVFLFFQLCGCVISGVDCFYQKHLKPTANLLNRHMSIGFTVPFVMICRNPLASPGTIGLIIACFVLTGVINTITSYTLALPLQALMSRCDKLLDPAGRFEAEDTRKRRSRIPGKPLSKDSSTMYRSSGEPPPLETAQSSTLAGSVYPQPELKTNSILSWMLQNPMLILSWTLTLIGLPIHYTTGSPTLLTTALLFAVWLTTLTLQTSIKTTPRLPPWVQTLLSGLANPVLWASLSLIAYAFAESAFTAHPLPTVLDTLQSHTTLSDLILNPSLPALAAGDVALSLLNAGLVAWGLKLYEYRAQLLSRVGLTVFSVSSLLALGNVALGPVLARAVGLGPAGRDLAFAARSVTLALGSPVMAMLGGDAGLNAAMVVVSGIVFQMALGFGAGNWLEKVLYWLRGRHLRRGNNNNDGNAEAQLSGDGERETCSEPETVAAGVAIGINAAAMGTAYLYEVGSEAAPYSALSMMALGIMTVVFASIQPLASWVVGLVSSTASS